MNLLSISYQSLFLLVPAQASTHVRNLLEPAGVPHGLRGLTWCHAACVSRPEERAWQFGGGQVSPHWRPTLTATACYRIRLLSTRLCVFCSQTTRHWCRRGLLGNGATAGLERKEGSSGGGAASRSISRSPGGLVRVSEAVHYQSVPLPKGAAQQQPCSLTPSPQFAPTRHHGCPPGEAVVEQRRGPP